MYEDLVKRLRYCANSDPICEAEDVCLYFEEAEKETHDYRCIERMMEQAADAIEELSCREAPMKITEIHVDEYYCPACGAENNCDQGYVQDAYCPVCGQRLFQEAEGW